MLAIDLLVLCVAAVSAVSLDSQRIVGGAVTTIENYPSIAGLLYTWDLRNYYQACAGVILNERSILTAGQCLDGEASTRWRVRLGSTYANSGGVVYTVNTILVHTDYNKWTKNNDIALLQVTGSIVFSSVVQPAQIAGQLYDVPDEQIVSAIGWGRTSSQGLASEQLRHVELLTFNQASCRRRYLPTANVITNQMLCAGWTVGGRGQCRGDTGGPLYHNNIVIGISSFSNGCGIGTFPSINTRVNSFISWILNNA